MLLSIFFIKLSIKQLYTFNIPIYIYKYNKKKNNNNNKCLLLSLFSGKTINLI